MDRSGEILAEMEVLRQHVVAITETQSEIAKSVVAALDRLTSAAEDMTLTMHLNTVITATAAIVGIRDWTTEKAVEEVQKIYEAFHAGPSPHE